MATSIFSSHTETLFAREHGTLPAFHRHLHQEMTAADSPSATRIDTMMASLDRLESAQAGNESSGEVLLAAKQSVHALIELRKDIRARQAEIIGADDFLGAHAVSGLDLAKAIASKAQDVPAVRQEIHAAESEGRPPVIRPQQMIGWPHPIGRFFMSATNRRAGEAQAVAAAESLRQIHAQATTTRNILALRDPMGRGAELELLESVERYVSGFERAMVFTSIEGRKAKGQLKTVELALSSGRIVAPELARAIEAIHATDRPAAMRWKAHQDRESDRLLRLGDRDLAAHLRTRDAIRRQQTARGAFHDSGLSRAAFIQAQITAVQRGKPPGLIWFDENGPTEPPQRWAGPMVGANNHPDHPNYAATMAALAAKRTRRSGADLER